ncbi:hypothetical protein [Nitrosopumilus adriaticus]|uniref:hypothetical protein n=1 Tax=Nitrosopumilus adriaticus TaxID=1580092 RepID=UPI00352CC5C4
MSNVNRHTVRLAVEQAMLKIGLSELEKVQSILSSKYLLTLDDCIDRPEILKGVLFEIYDSHYDEIFQSIQKSLSANLIEPDIDNFVKLLKLK